MTAKSKAGIGAIERITTHPGVMLGAEFLEPLGLSASGLARELGIPQNRISEIIAGRRSVSADTALLLAERFGTTPEFWLNLQMMHDLSKAIAARRILKPKMIRLARPARKPKAA